MLEILKIGAILAAILLNFFFSISVYIRNRKSLPNILFSIVASWFGIWGLCLLLYEYPVFFNSLFWLRGAYISATCMEMFVVWFAFIFPTPSLRKMWRFTIVYSIVFTVFSIYFLLSTSLWIEKVTLVSFGHAEAMLGPFYIYWTLGEWVLIGISVWSLLTNYIATKGVYKAQLLYLLCGFFLFGIAVNIPDVIAPLFFHTSRYFGISSLLSIIFTGTVFYIILRHRFLDLHRTMRKVGYYALAIFVLGLIYLGITLFLGRLFFPRQFFPRYTVTVVLTILLFRYLTTPLQAKIGKRVKKIFIQGLYDRNDVITELTELSTKTTDLKTMVEKTLEICYNAFLPEFLIGLSFQDDERALQMHYPTSKKTHQLLTHTQAKSIVTIQKITLTDELPEGKLKQSLQKIDIAAVIPFHAGMWRRYILLGPKQSGESYYTYDVDTFVAMRPILRLLGMHIRQVEEIRQFGQDLKKEVSKATAALRMSNKHLQIADKLKNEFISIASHELKTPTTAIQGFLWLVLQKDKKLSTYSREKLEKIAKLTEHMSDLVNDMLDVSKIESKRITLHPEAFDIAQLVYDIKGEMDVDALHKHIHIGVMQTKGYMVWADKHRIRQVVCNLLNNAVKYTPENGKISIQYKRRNGMIELSIQDTGIGIKKEDISRLFTKFGKLEHGNVAAQLPGTGLGLYIAKNLINLSGGEINVKSTYKKGSTFSFSLPIQEMV